MADNFFKDLEKEDNNKKKVIVKTKGTSTIIETEDRYIDALIVSALLPFIGLLIYAINIGSNRSLARKCLIAALIGMGIALLLLFLSIMLTVIVAFL